MTDTVALDPIQRIARPRFTAVLSRKEALALEDSLGFVNESLGELPDNHDKALVLTQNGDIVTVGLARRGRHGVVTVSRT